MWLTLTGCILITDADIARHDQRFAARYLVVVDESEGMIHASQALAVALQSVSFPKPAVTALASMQSRSLLVNGVGSGGKLLLAPLLCDAACVRRIDLPSEPDYECGANFDRLTVEVMDCTCPGEDWAGDCDSDAPEAIDAAVDAATDNELSSDVAAPVFVLLVTNQGDESGGVVEDYVDELEGAVVSVIGPRLNSGDDPACSAASRASVNRYLDLVDQADGVYTNLERPSCEVADLVPALEAFAEQR